MGRVCRDLLRPVFMSLLSRRGEPIQFGYSQLLFPEWLRRVGLVGALIALSYIRLTASVAMPSMAAPPTPSTSRALERTKSMAVPMPLSSFLLLRSPAPAIAHLRMKAEHAITMGDLDQPSCPLPQEARPQQVQGTL